VWSEELPCKNYPTTGTVLFDYNHTHQEVKFLLTYLVLMLRFFDKNFQCSITLCTQSLNTTEAPGYTPTHLRAFKWYQKHCKGYCGLGKLNMTNIQGFPMVPKALQGLLWAGKAQHDKHPGLSNGTKSIARAIVGWESST
jgi:hypothetical protein